MKFLSLVPALAVAGVLALTSAAVAQKTVGSQTVMDSELGAVQTRCDELAAGADAAAPATPATPVAPPADAVTGAESGLDLTAITLEDCRAADLVE